MPGHFRLSPPSWTDRHTWPETHAGIDPMPDKMGLDYLKLHYFEFQKYEAMTMSAEGGQPKRKPNYKATKHIERSFLISDYYQLQVTATGKCVPCTFNMFQPFPQTQTQALALPLCISFVSTIIFV